MYKINQMSCIPTTMLRNVIHQLKMLNIHYRHAMWCIFSDFTVSYFKLGLHKISERRHSAILVRPAVSPWIKSMFELNITTHVIASQLSGFLTSSAIECDVIGRNRASETRGRCVKIIVFIVMYGFVMSCKKWNDICTLVTNCLCTNSRVLFWRLFPSLLCNSGNKHQNNPLMSA